MLPLTLTSTKDYGTYGVSLCATYFMANGYQVLLPYGDKGHYDLVVEKEGIFQRVQCKWTTKTKYANAYPVVSMSVTGSAVRDGIIVKNNIHHYVLKDFDLLWVTTPYSCYLIPLNAVLNEDESITSFALYPKWDKYKVQLPIPSEEGESLKHRYGDRLTDDEKQLVRQFHQEGKSHQAIADMLGVTRACISSFLIRGNAK